MADETPQMGEWAVDLTSQPMVSHHLYFHVCVRFLTLTRIHRSLPLGLVASGLGPSLVLTCLVSDPILLGPFFPLSPSPDKIRVFRTHAGFFLLLGICGILACGSCLTWNQQIGILEPRSSGLPKRNLSMPTRHGHASAPPSLVCMRIAVYSIPGALQGCGSRHLFFALVWLRCSPWAATSIAWLGLSVLVFCPSTFLYSPDPA